VQLYDGLAGPFSRECRTPCVIFTGHPSLRLGPVVHLLDLWGGDARNALMVTGKTKIEF
jgi:integrator complex subunit 9